MLKVLVVLALMVSAVAAMALPALAVPPAVDWEKEYGDTSRDIAYWVEEVSSGGFVVSGYADFENDGNLKAILLRLDSDGDTLWTKTYGDSLSESAMCVRETSDGGFIVSGYIERGPGNSDAWLVRTDSSGDTLWTSTFDFGGDEFLYCVEELYGGDFIAAGFTSSYATLGSTDILVMRISSGGVGMWKTVLGGPGHNRGYGMCRTSDGHYVVAGYTEVGADRGDGIIIKVNASNGDSLWSTTHGDTTFDTCRRVFETYDGGLVAGGRMYDHDGRWSLGYLVKMDAVGNEIWLEDYGDTSAYTSITSLALTPDLGFICAGYRDTSSTGLSDLYFIKTDAAGDTLWTKAVVSPSRDAAVEVKMTGDMGYISAGYRRELPGVDYDIHVMKLATDEARVTREEDLCAGDLLSVNGTNPFIHEVVLSYEIAPASHVKLAVYDVTGRHVVTLEDGLQGPGSHSITWDCRNRYGDRVPAGVYFIDCSAAGRRGTEKVLLLR